MGDIREPYLEVVTAALVGGLRYLLGDRFRDATLELPYAPPPHARRYAEVLDMPVVFDCDVAALRFPAPLMKVTFPLSDPASRRMAAHKCEEELQRLEADLDWASRVLSRATDVMARSRTPTCLADVTLLQALIQDHRDLVSPPSAVWLRPTGQTGVAALATMPQGSSPNFYLIS